MPDPSVPPAAPVAASGPAYAPTPRDRRILKIVLIVVGLAVLAFAAMFGLLFGFVMKATAGPVTAADKFLTTTAAQGPAAAWQTGSSALRASGSEADWETFARRSGLTSYRASHWSSRRVDNAGGSVSGSVDTAVGAVPLTIELVRNGDDWQVQRVTGAPAGFNTAPDAGMTPVNSQADF